MRRRISVLILTLSLSACVETSAVVIAQASYSSVPQASDLDVVISEIAWMGTTASPTDVWVELHNNTTSAVDLSGWTLRDEANHVFTFPSHVMERGQRCRVYTNEDHPEWCGFSYGSGSAIWNNSGDCAELRDSYGGAVDTYCC